LLRSGALRSARIAAPERCAHYRFDYYGPPVTPATTETLQRAKAIRFLSCDVDGVLTDGRIFLGAGGAEWKSFAVVDGLGLKMLDRSGIVVAWISGRRSEAVARRASELGIRHLIEGADNKLAPWQGLLRELSVTPEQCAHIGDDLPDLPLLERCGFAATVPHAPDVVKRSAHYISTAPAGHGAVRELCELLLSAQGLLDLRQAEFRTGATA